MTEDISATKLRHAWRLHDMARSAGNCGKVVDLHDSRAMHFDLRACHLPATHAGPHAARWRTGLISWDFDGTQAGLDLRQIRLDPRLDTLPTHKGDPSEPDPESSGAFLRRVGVDGVLWAQEFAKAFGGDPTPGGTLHGWVCNMIEAGRSAGYWEARRQRAQGDAVPSHELGTTDALAVAIAEAAGAITRDVLRPSLAAAGVDNPDQYHVEAEVTPLAMAPLGRVSSFIPPVLIVEPSPAAGVDTSSPPAASTPGLCGGQSILWPDDEQCDVECTLLAGHLGDHSDGASVTWSRDTDTKGTPDQHPNPAAAWALLQLSSYAGNPWGEDVRETLLRLVDNPDAWASLASLRHDGGSDADVYLAKELRRWLDSDEGREQFALPCAPTLDRAGLLAAWPHPQVNAPVVYGVNTHEARHYARLVTGIRRDATADTLPENLGVTICSDLDSLRARIQGRTGGIVAITPARLAKIMEERAGRLRGPVDGPLGELLAATRVVGVYACFPPVD